MDILMTNPSAKERIFNIVKSIPKGKVLTYGRVAKMAGIKSPQVVGNALHRNTDPQLIPCHRVVSIKGELASAYAFGGREVQRKKLEEEGVIFEGGKVNLLKSLWEKN